MFEKITDFGDNCVSSAPDILTGTAAENKALFDKAVKNVVATAFNKLVGDLALESAPEHIGAEGGTLKGLLDGLKQNLSDVSGTIDTKVAEALNDKVDKEEGKGLSDNNFSDEDKEKLDGLSEEIRANAELLKNKVDKDGNKVLSDNNYSDEDKAKLDGVETKMTKLWETTLTEAEIQVRPDNNDNLNLIKGKLIIDIPPITEPLGGRPIVYIGQYTGEQATTDNMASGFSTSVFKKAGECPLFMLEFEIVGSNRCITCSKTYRMGTNTGGCSVTTSGILIEKSDSDERCAVNTIHIMYENYFPVGTKFELWGY